jgi:hypothetical protein
MNIYVKGEDDLVSASAGQVSYLLLKTEHFSRLFQRYATDHGLSKEELEFYFVDVLKGEDTPATVHAVEGDTIMVCATSWLRVTASAELESF